MYWSRNVTRKPDEAPFVLEDRLASQHTTAQEVKDDAIKLPRNDKHNNSYIGAHRNREGKSRV